MSAIELFYANDFFDEVVQYSNDILKLDSLNIRAYKYISSAYRVKEDYETAIYYLKHALKIDFDKDDINEILRTSVMIGNLYLKDGNYPKAIQILEIACKNADLLGDDKLFAYCNMSFCYNMTNNKEKAEYYYKLAHEIDAEKTPKYINELKYPMKRL
jgi:tetratricopeptide (TPR) repeat protein